MEKSKRKLSTICISLIVILSVALTMFGLFGANGTVISNGTNSNIGAGMTVAKNGSDYLAGVEGGTDAYIDFMQYASKPGWKAISTAQNLRDFLMNVGDYVNQNGFLTNDITDFNWDGVTDDAANLAPRIKFSKLLDGCGCTITFNGRSTTKINDGNGGDGVDAAMDTNKMGVLSDQTRKGLVNNGSDYYYASFGGLVTVLQENAQLKNFKFVIDSDHRFIHNVSSTKQLVYSVAGGLVGYQEGGLIDNVIVELAQDREFGVGHTQNGIEAIVGTRDNCVINGLVTGISEGGTISNTTAILREQSILISYSCSLWAGTTARAWQLNGLSYVGAIAGYAENTPTIKNVALNVYGEGNNSGVIRSYVDRYSNTIGSDGDYYTRELAGGIVGFADAGVRVIGAMVSGNMNCLSTSNRTAEINMRRKNIFVADGKQPESMLYVNATGGINTDGAGESSSSSFDRTLGYTNESNKIMITLDNNMAAYFDKNVDGNLQLFMPEDKIIWTYCGKNMQSSLITGKDEDFSRRSLAAPLAGEIGSDASGNKRTVIELGTSTTGEVGIYKRTPTAIISDPYVEQEAVFDANGNWQAGTSWTEMSDQTRMAIAGARDIPELYYDGTKYAIKIKIGVSDASGNLQFRLFDDGSRIKNIGDLKNSMNSYNGRPVKLYCNDSSGIAYMDNVRRIVVMLDDITSGMDKTLSIQKRHLWVETSNYVRSQTGIFDGATVKFGRLPEDPQGLRSGLITGSEYGTVAEYIKWQNENFSETDTIHLNVAGRQLLRPSTNNYILRHRVYWGNPEDPNYSSQYYDEDLGSYFSAIVLPHSIKVDEGIYINGEAIKATDNLGNTVYNVMNARTDKAEYNDTKRKIVVSVRLKDNHFTAKNVIFKDKAGKTVTNYLDAIGGSTQTIVWKDAAGNPISGDLSLYNDLIFAELYINNPQIASIEFVDYVEKHYTVTVNDGTSSSTKTDYKYGERVYLSAPEPEAGKVFVGWQREKDNSFITYHRDYSLKVTENFNVTAIYEDVNAGSWTHTYYSAYGELIRVAQAREELALKFSLPNQMGWTFVEWVAKDIDYTNRTAEFIAKFEKKAEDSPTVNITWIRENNSASVTNAEYGEPIKLEAGKVYNVNNARVEVGENDYTIYAINDMVLEEIQPSTTKSEEQSMYYNAFAWGEKDTQGNVINNTYYISVTFVYGDENAIYGDTVQTNKPTITMTGFDANDITQYVRQGNIYQLSLVITAQELECRFGSDAEIATFLTVEDYTFENIMIFKRKSTDMTGKAN